MNSRAAVHVKEDMLGQVFVGIAAHSVGRTLEFCKLGRSGKSICLLLSRSLGQGSSGWNGAGRQACSPRTSLGKTRSRATVSISFERRLSAESVDGPSLPLERSSAAAGDLGSSEQVVVILSLLD